MRSSYFTSFAPQKNCAEQQNVLLQLVFNYLHMMIPPTPRQVLFVCAISHASWQIMLTLPSLRSLTVMSWTLRKCSAVCCNAAFIIISLSTPTPSKYSPTTFCIYMADWMCLKKIVLKMKIYTSDDGSTLHHHQWFCRCRVQTLTLRRGDTTIGVAATKSNWACCFNKSTGDLASLNLC